MNAGQSHENYSITGRFTPLPEEAFGSKIQRCVLPICVRVQDQFVPLGTGFVIAPDGLIMTAAHVLDQALVTAKATNPTGQRSFEIELFAFYVTSERHEDSENFIGGPWPILRSWYANGHDIGVCALAPLTRDNNERVRLPTFRLSPGPPKVGDQVLGFGYHQMVAAEDKHENDMIVVEYKRKTAFTRGTVKEVYNLKRDSSMLNFPSFRMDARFDPGMSGGPIINQAGYVCGVICASGSGGTSDNDHVSYGAMIWPSMGIMLDFPDNGRIERTPLFELAKNGVIATDETFAKVAVDVRPEGVQQIHYRESG